MGTLVGPFVFHGTTLLLIFAICGIAALYCVVVQTWVFRHHPQWLERGHLMSVGDIVLASAVVLVTGGLHSEFYLVYFLRIMSSVRFGGPSTLTSLLLIMTSYVAAVLGAGAPLTLSTAGMIAFRLGFLATATIFASFVVDRARYAE